MKMSNIIHYFENQSLGHDENGLKCGFQTGPIFITIRYYFNNITCYNDWMDW